MRLREWFDRYIFPLPPEAQIMTGWNEAGEDRHHWGSLWWREYRARCRRWWPVRHWLHWAFPIWLAVWKRRLITQPIWWVRHRLPPHRYHVLPTGLPPGYYDPDTRFLHAIMEEVCRYVEITKETIDWDYDEEHRIAWKTLTEAVAFWKGYKHFRKHEFDSPRYERAEQAKTKEEKHAVYLAIHAEEEKWENQADAHLIAIMKIRRGIWYP